MAADYDAPRNTPETNDNVVSIDARAPRRPGLQPTLTAT
jgi:hypothetical protein